MPRARSNRALPKPVDKVDELDTVFRETILTHSTDGEYVSLADIQRAYVERQKARRRGHVKEP